MNTWIPLLFLCACGNPELDQPNPPPDWMQDDVLPVEKVQTKPVDAPATIDATDIPEEPASDDAEAAAATGEEAPAAAVEAPVEAPPADGAAE